MVELIAPHLVDRALLFMGVAGPVAGSVLGAALGASGRWPGLRAPGGAVAGALVGALGTLIYAMWRVYGAITDALGLDSVANLALQLVMFAAAGSLLAVAIFRIQAFLKRARAGS